ncbi:MAG: 16S rRNA (cytosine(1402)-N(4))-methyltransferase RsmH [Paracoccaceae bacterium]|nr:MAG: 16S rRNA (cytosine(1402)-N(4))-methyltransferase RsmH [Paracoccaceae bacterium]
MPGRDAADPPHVPVLLGPLLAACAPVRGHWLDGTFGAGGYARGLLAAGADRVTGIDRDPLALDLAQGWIEPYGDRLRLVAGTFSDLDTLADGPLDGVVLDLGVSSMQLDLAERGFSFLRDGPLDMRMSQQGETAADLVNTAPEDHLADVIYHYGEDRAARRIARAITAARAQAPIVTTLRLAEVVASVLPRPKPGQSHPATRAFQAIRIAVNAEFSELVQGLAAAERALAPGGLLAVVTFHSLEDRIVKRFFQDAAGGSTGNRYAPEQAAAPARFTPVTRGAVAPDDAELATNPRARSAKLRVGRRTAAPPVRPDPAALGAPVIADVRPARKSSPRRPQARP